MCGNVGPTGTRITDYPTADFDKLYDVNLKGSFLITKYTLMQMEKTGTGRLLLISSMAGKEGNPGMIGYSSTKAGVIGLVKGVAKEFADTNITVNGLAPAVIKTSMNENTSAEQLAYMTAKIPMNRLGTVKKWRLFPVLLFRMRIAFQPGLFMIFPEDALPTDK